MTAPEDCNVMLVHNRGELAAAIIAAADNGPTVIRFRSAAGTVVTYRFNMLPDLPQLSEQRARSIAARLRRSAAEVWQ